MTNIREETFRLMRELHLTTVFGNPGSTEEPFLQDFPSDFHYVLGLQEASVVAMADGYAQAMNRPALVNLHTAPGVGNAMGAIVGAWHNKTPLIITAGQQTREMMLLEPWLMNIEATSLPKPYVKWSYETARAEDAPGALMRAFVEAYQAPMGPVFLSVPMDDWEKPALRETSLRKVSICIAPDPNSLSEIGVALDEAANPALVFGAGVDRSHGWPEAVGLAERVRASVYAAPVSERAGFPEDHALFMGPLPFAIGPLCEKLKGHDVVVVMGAPVFRYYPYVAGEFLPEGTRLFHITDDPREASCAPVGDAVVGDPALACASLRDQVQQTKRPMPTPREKPAAPEASTPMTADALFYALSQTLPENVVIVQESPSNMEVFHKRLPAKHPMSYFSMASGGLGFGLPASVGIALAERETGRNRPVVAVIGDGSFQYSVQALYTAAQEKLPVLVIVPNNTEYGILKSFAEFGETTQVPGLDLPGVDLVSIARGFGCAGRRVEALDELASAVQEALASGGPFVLEVAISAGVPPLLPS